MRSIFVSAWVKFARSFHQLVFDRPSKAKQFFLTPHTRPPPTNHPRQPIKTASSVDTGTAVKIVTKNAGPQRAPPDYGRH